VYTISQAVGQVGDIGTSTQYVAGGLLGSFRVGIPTVFVVNATNDESTDTDGKTCLREALANANVDKISPDTITFDPSIFAGSQTITLTFGRLEVKGNTVIQGPGADRLIIDAQGLSSVWNVSSDHRIDVTLSGIKITN